MLKKKKGRRYKISDVLLDIRGVVRYCEIHLEINITVHVRHPIIFKFLLLLLQYSK